MLLIMAPLIGFASFGSDFQEDYPSYPDTMAHQYLGVPKWVTVLFFELVYGWDFVATEWIFRGFFVIGMASVMGRRAVLPMVVTYAFLHFGKPLGETIGSIFGGYILGVIALRTGSIWGGIAIHLGVAWLMEIAAFLQRL
jgi:membrane protease YdiL (CAAX protease family)